MLRFELTVLRHQGIPLKRWQIGAQVRRIGHLVLAYELDPLLNRTCLVARLKSNDPDLVLWDAHLAPSVGTTYLVLDGLEYVDIGPGREAHVAQSWTLRPVADARRDAA